MASCCRQRRKKTEPLPESQEFKPLTLEHLAEVRELVKERLIRENELKKKKEAARELRKRLEAGEITEEEFDAAERNSVDGSVDAEEAARNEEDAKKDKENKRLEKTGPNKRMEAGKSLSPKYAADFQKHLVGIPLIDIDPFYKEKEVFIVVGKDLNVTRFSATAGLFCLGPFNPIRRIAISTLVHPLFNLVVMLTILTNCVFMAKGEEIDAVEYAFTAIYTFEFLVKMLARGMILAPFTYLRDAWNWLDFLVISLAYVMLIVEQASTGDAGKDALGNVAALRTFRVLRALKTVAVVPGLKTIVGALMEAVIKMRDVGILTVFMLAIFALVGLQLYKGNLHHKCILEYPSNLTDDQMLDWKNNENHWLNVSMPDHLICGNSTGAGSCPYGFFCENEVGINPNFGYTSWDNFGSCMLNAFRIMTQDYWENIYFITIRASGTMHFFFFVLFILLGSFYLMNLILAIVAMAYNDQQERDRNELLAEQNEKQESDAAAAQEREDAADALADAAEGKEEQDRHMREACDQVRKMNASRAPSRVPSLEKLLTPKPFIATDRVSLKTDFDMDNPDPTLVVNNPKGLSGELTGSITDKEPSRHNRRPRPSLGNVGLGIDNPLPYADDSQAVTPSSIDAPVTFENYGLESNGTSHFNSALRASLKSRASRASVRSKSSCRAPNNHIPNRALNNNNVTDDQNKHRKGGQLENEMLPANETPNQYTSLLSLDSNNVNMKGVQDLKEMMDIKSHARTIDEQNVSKSEVIKARLKQIFCSWMCCPCFLNVQKYLDLFITDAFMEVFIMLCILCNTAFMAIEYHGQPDSLTDVLTGGNYFFTTVFTLECVCKLVALGPSKYFREAWNTFDFIVVSCSLVELGQELNGGSGGGGLSVLRSLRLLRVLKLAKSWQTLNSLLMIVAKSLGALGNLTIILIIVIFIFAVMGTQLFAENYNKMAYVFSDEPLPPEWAALGVQGRIPRWNFKNFLHGFMIVFRVLCGEWIESMWNCMRTKQEYLCVPFFLLTMVIGSLVVLNLFLVLLLSSFSADALDGKAEEDEVDKITEAKGRIVRFFAYIKKGIVNKFCAWRQQRTTGTKNNGLAFSDSQMEEMSLMKGNGTNGVSMNKDKYKDSLLDESDGLSNSKTVTLIPLLNDYDESMEKETSLEKLEQFSTAASSCESLDDAETLVSKFEGADSNKNPELTEVEVEYETLPSACCFPVIAQRCDLPEENPIMIKFWALRCFTYRLVEHKYFETFIIVCILMSSMSLALEDIYLEDKYTLKLILNYMDKIFSGIFICEMLLKWTAFGFHKYFTDAWCWLDFVIVGISITGLVMESIGMESMSAFKAMRTLRALRPLRAVSRWEGMRVVVNALIQAVPSISNVLLVIMIFWLIFAIMGVNFFKGKFSKCVDAGGNFLHVYYREYPVENITADFPDYEGKLEEFNYVAHVLNVTNKTTCIENGYNWTNSPIHFDSVPNAYLALLQVATYKGWMEIMADATDAAVEIDDNPVYERNTLAYVYFVMFIVFGSFFTLNLFIGVIIENFNAQKKKAGGSIEMFMTDDQKKYYNAMKKLSASGPSKATPRPKWKPQAAVFDFTMNQKFDVAIMMFILLNMITMCAEYANQPDDYTEILKYVNIVFIVVFTLEAILKLIALRHYYFTFPWNVFDFVVVLFSILGLAFQDAIQQYLKLDPTVLRVVRVLRVGRVLRLVKSAKGIRTLLFSLLVSLPALFNIGLLLFLVMFIYATFGMAFFSRVEYMAGIDEVFNFSTFFRALITLFQCTTSAGWNGVLAAITNEDPATPEAKQGNKPLGIAYMITYLLFTFLVIINMYIAVILENFSQATEDVQQGITQDDIEMYYELWATYDPKATKYIPVDKLFDLVDELEDPLRVAKPNYFRLVMTDIPVCEGDRIHCSDILDMLTKLFLGQENDPAADENMPQADVKEKYGEDYKPIYGLLERQRHKWAARFIWRRYLAYKEAKNRRLGITGDDELPADTSNEAEGESLVATVTIENEQKLSDESTDQADSSKKNLLKKSKSKKQLKEDSS